MLAWTIYISYLTAALLFVLPRSTRPELARILALLAAIAGFAIALSAFCAKHTGPIVDLNWIPLGSQASGFAGIHYALSADGISLALVLLTGIIAIAGVLFSWDIADRTNEFFAFYLLLIGSVYGVFLAADAFLLFVFYEIVIIPKYFLIAVWGSTRREYGAMKLAIYSFVGSAMVLGGLIAAYAVSGAHSTELTDLVAASTHLSPHFQLIAFPIVFTGFAILAGLWPFHTWAPTGHVAAPTAASMLLAGVVMKLGAYGCLRVAMTLFPLGLAPWTHTHLGLHSWRDLFALLAAIGIVYGAFAALAQRDFKFVIGYSSVSHMGFILLGLMTLNLTGLSGAILQMISHGLLAGLLFAVVGRMVYARTHTRELAQLGPMNLNRALPFAAVTFVIAAVAAMGIPGFSGFVAELMILLGAWRAYPLLACSTGLGILIGVAYIWRAMQKAFFSGTHSEDAATVAAASDSHSHHHDLTPITLPEKLAAILLIASSLIVGLFPRLLLDVIQPALNSPAFSALHDGLRYGGPWQ